MRLIDSDALIESIKHGLWDWETVNGIESRTVLEQTIQDIRNEPTIDAEPVRHGKWIWDDEGYHCSECWYHAQGNTLECFDGTFKFCPVCGAKMDEVNDEEE